MNDYVSIKDLISEKISGEWGADPTSEHKIAVIRTTNFTNVGKLKLDKLAVRDISDSKIATKKLTQGDVIIEKSGGSPTQPVGRVVYFDVNDGNNYLCNNFTSILRPSSKVYPKYLFYGLFFLHLTKKTLAYQNKTTGIINLQLDRYISNEKIKLPSFQEQIRTVKILDKVDGIYHNRNLSLEKMDSYLNAVFTDMFGDLSKNDHNFTKISINEVVDIQSGQVDPKNPPYASMTHIGGADIESGSGRIIRKQTAKEAGQISGKYLFNKEYLLYSKIRPYLNKVALPDFDGICSADIYPIKPRSVLDRYFLAYVLRSDSFLSHAAGNSSRTNIPKINRNDLLKYQIILPPIEQQKSFSAIVNSIESLKYKMRAQSDLIDIQFHALMQKAFS